MTSLQRFEPIEVGTRLRIVPPGTQRSSDRCDLVLTRGAFGSGEHETTVSCLEMIEALHPGPASRVLDLGCGTGILAAAALLMGHHHAVCIDIDPAAVALTRLNCRVNGLAHRVCLVAGELAAITGARYDLVLANIYADVLLAAADQLVAATVSGAMLILSGIPWQDNFDIRQRYESLGCEVKANQMLEEYSTVVLRRVR